MNIADPCGRAGVLLAVALILVPVEVRFDPQTGLPYLAATTVAAKNGDDDRSGDDRGGDRSGRGGDRDDDRSGRGGGDRDDRDEDRSGGDRDRDRGEDRSGRGGGDRNGRDDRREDRSGRGGGDRDDRGGIEVPLADGGRIEIENGRFERKDASGRTVEERPATTQDFRRAMSERTDPAGTPRGGGTVTKVEVSGNDIEIVYADGWKEEIEAGRYELKDALNRTVIERPARSTDLQRLSNAVR